MAETGYSYEDDVNATNQLLDKIQEYAPKADIHYLEGNHERRIEKWCVTTALRNGRDAHFLLNKFGAKAELCLDLRKINFYKQGECYHGLLVPATIKLGKCFFTHGTATGKYACATHLRKFGNNVVHGHTHRADSHTTRTVENGTIAAYSPGCLSNLQPLWNHTNPTEWSHGYGLQVVNADGQFLHINIPIIDGKSYLQPLIARLS